MLDMKDRPALFSRKKCVEYCISNNIDILSEGYYEGMGSMEEDALFAKALDYHMGISYETGTIAEWYENWQLIDPEHRIDSIVFLDTETTGMGGYTCSIALITIDLLSLTVIQDKTIYLEINPNEKIEEEAYQVHKLSQEYLSDKPSFADHYDKIKEILDYSELKCAYNGIFDIGVINRDLSRIGKDRILNVYYLDPMRRLRSVVCAKDINGKVKFPRLEESVDFFNIKTEDGDLVFHNALYDTEMLKNVFIASLSAKE